MNWERASGSKDRTELWRARHELGYAFRKMKGMSVLGSDVCVPLSQLAVLVVYARTLIDKSGLLGGVFGHVGDGNFHTIIVYPTDDQEQENKAKTIDEKLVLKAIEVGGTCTGEHGVGLGKIKYQEMEHGSALEVMKSIKTLLDPKNRLNPGKIFGE